MTDGLTDRPSNQPTNMRVRGKVILPVRINMLLAGQFMVTNKQQRIVNPGERARIYNFLEHPVTLTSIKQNALY